MRIHLVLLKKLTFLKSSKVVNVLNSHLCLLFCHSLFWFGNNDSASLFHVCVLSMQAELITNSRPLWVSSLLFLLFRGSVQPCLSLNCDEFGVAAWHRHALEEMTVCFQLKGTLIFLHFFFLFFQVLVPLIVCKHSGNAFVSINKKSD